MKALDIIFYARLWMELETGNNCTVVREKRVVPLLGCELQ